MNDPLGITPTNLFEIPKWLWVAKQSSSQPIIWQRPYGRLHRLTIHGGKRIHGISLIKIHWSLKKQHEMKINWNYRTYVTPLPTKHHIFTLNVWWSRERLKGIQCHFPFIQCFKFKVVYLPRTQSQCLQRCVDVPFSWWSCIATGHDLVIQWPTFSAKAKNARLGFGVSILGKTMHFWGKHLLPGTANLNDGLVREFHTNTSFNLHLRIWKWSDNLRVPYVLLESARPLKGLLSGRRPSFLVKALINVSKVTECLLKTSMQRTQTPPTWRTKAF